MNPSAQKSFEAVKVALTKAPILALSGFTKTFVLQTNASGTGMGAVVTQNGHPISYFSAKFISNLTSQILQNLLSVQNITSPTSQILLIILNIYFL